MFDIEFFLDLNLQTSWVVVAKTRAEGEDTHEEKHEESVLLFHGQG